ncbi:MAG: hypothetical protein QOH89_1695 [Pseudonocardiales bacterium]|nr:hypothetical protein [Pseudonocardiales bacterium]
MQIQGAVVVGLGGPSPAPELIWGAREATALHRPLHLIRAYNASLAVLPWDTYLDREFAVDLRRAAEDQLRAALQYVNLHWPDLGAEGTVVEGFAAEVLGKASRDAHLTVLGSRRLGPVGSAVLGSVSAVVAATAAGPVVLVGSPPADPAQPAQVVVGVDGSKSMDDVLDFAFGYADRHQRPLHAIFCWSPDLLASMQWRPEPPPPERADRWLAEALAGWQQKYPEVQVHRGVVRASPVAGLVAESTAQELLVVGGHSQHARISALLGSVSQGVLHHATCPVAVVHPRATGWTVM